MHIRITLTATRELEVKPEWYRDNKLPSFEEVARIEKTSVEIDPESFIDNPEVEIKAAVEEIV